MALAVTHIILTIVILDLFRHYVFGKKKFPRYLLVIGGIAGLGPDLDIPISWVYSLLAGVKANFHGTFTHSLIWPLIFLGIALILHYKKEMKWAKIFYVIAVGFVFHLSLDCLFGGYKSFLWPFLVAPNFCPEWGIINYAVSIDALILVLWLVHEEIHKKIKDYI
ncbi:MAG: metal-dependent hydrolase [Nanoarchaeota archaeon]|nr:metal-dependent hydrolase [Nanoarchaeota archaeon]MBU1623295.1 metal-dependent hydrolase [Nanoarchaeota archaeon]MBU1974069.1 metal-dependent hydrolase [Nanoarchaeota archaeon]